MSTLARVRVVPSAQAPAWLERWRGGVVYPHTYSVYMDGERHAIVRAEGRHYHGGQGRPWLYAPVHYMLVRKDLGYDAQCNRTVHEGRMTRAAEAMLRVALRTADQKAREEPQT